MTDTDYQTEARKFFTSVRDGLHNEQDLIELLDAADGTLAEWREDNPDAIEADRLATEIGFDIPHTDDYCWQAADALREYLSETGGYGADVYKTIRIILAGGGPSGWIEFTVDQDGGLRGARVGYVNWFQMPVEFDLDDADAEFAFRRYSADVLAERG